MINRAIKYSSILFFLILLSSCKGGHKEGNLPNTDFIKEKGLSRESIKENQNYIVFLDKDSLRLKSNDLPNDTIKSLLIEKKALLVNYLYCGKKIPSIDVQSSLKEINNLEYENFKKFRTGHNFVLDKDTLYFQGRNGVKCQENNSTVLLECSLYQMIFKNDTINYPVIDKIIKK